MNERFAQKNEQFTHSLFFGERPERFAHDRSFLLSDLSELLTSLIFGERLNDSVTLLTKKEEMSASLIFSIIKLYIKHTKKQDFRFF